MMLQVLELFLDLHLIHDVLLYLEVNLVRHGVFFVHPPQQADLGVHLVVALSNLLDYAADLTDVVGDNDRTHYLEE